MRLPGFQEIFGLGCSARLSDFKETLSTRRNFPKLSDFKKVFELGNFARLLDFQEIFGLGSSARLPDSKKVFQLGYFAKLADF